MCHGKNNHGDGRREATKIYGQEGITAANARVVPKVGVVFVHWGCVPGLHHVAELPRVDNHDRTGAIHESQPAGLMEVLGHGLPVAGPIGLAVAVPNTRADPFKVLRQCHLPWWSGGNRNALPLRFLEKDHPQGDVAADPCMHSGGRLAACLQDSYHLNDGLSRRGPRRKRILYTGAVFIVAIQLHVKDRTALEHARRRRARTPGIDAIETGRTQQLVISRRHGSE
mmetsp:Transcript_64801/g.151872  ORF Transcript_64801/g.151872 Transcript_64801/m.151872 type:complete len:226 (+) Transcript_64801:72-749(+)